MVGEGCQSRYPTVQQPLPGNYNYCPAMTAEDDYFMLTIYHNPRCSKSRQTLALIDDQGVEVDIIRYLETPLDAGAIAELLDKLGMKARDVIRTGEAAYKENNLKDTSLGEDALIAAIVAHPILLQRPIVVSGDHAIIGRPPENVLSLFS